MSNQNKTEEVIDSHLKKVGKIVQSFTEDFYTLYDKELNAASSDAEYEVALQKAKIEADKRLNQLSQELANTGITLSKNLEAASREEDMNKMSNLENMIESL